MTELAIRDELLEIKGMLRENNKLAVAVAAQGKQIENIERRVNSMETACIDINKRVGKMQTTCAIREPVYHWGAKRMGEPPTSPNDWFTMFVGGAVRNGVWILFTGLLVPTILYFMGVKK